MRRLRRFALPDMLHVCVCVCVCVATLESAKACSSTN